jgi:hypothetical protein
VHADAEAFFLQLKFFTPSGTYAIEQPGNPCRRVGFAKRANG